MGSSNLLTCALEIREDVGRRVEPRVGIHPLHECLHPAEVGTGRDERRLVVVGCHPVLSEAGGGKQAVAESQASLGVGFPPALDLAVRTERLGRTAVADRALFRLVRHSQGAEIAPPAAFFIDLLVRQRPLDLNDSEGEAGRRRCRVAVRGSRRG